MKKLMAVALAVVLVLTLGSAVVLAKPDKVKNDKGNSRSVMLENKEEGWGAIDDDTFGWLTYRNVMGNGNFNGTLVIKGAEANSWYLVTLDHPSWVDPQDADTATNLGSVGYYDKVSKASWADIALFQTDADGNASVHLPYTSPAWDPAFEALIAPTLPTGDYTGVTIAVKYVGEGSSPDWGMVINGGASSWPEREKNLYEMNRIDFTIAEPSQEVMILVQKNSTTWDVINYPTTWGELKYRVSGPEFDFDFDGFGLATDTDYSLIYYPEPQTTWPWPVTVIASGTSNSGGDIHLAGSYDFAADFTDVKIWLVLTADISGGSLSGWNPTDYLFEYDLITYDDTDV